MTRHHFPPWLVPMTIVKCILVNTTKVKRPKKIITKVNRKTVVKWVLWKVYFVVVIIVTIPKQILYSYSITVPINKRGRNHKNYIPDYHIKHTVKD